MKCRVEKGVVFMGVAFRELPGGRSGGDYLSRAIVDCRGAPTVDTAFMGSHLLPTDHDREDASTPAARVRNRHHADCRVTVERRRPLHLIGDGPAKVPRHSALNARVATGCQRFDLCEARHGLSLIHI